MVPACGHCKSLSCCCCLRTSVGAIRGGIWSCCSLFQAALSGEPLQVCGPPTLLRSRSRHLMTGDLCLHQLGPVDSESCGVQFQPGKRRTTILYRIPACQASASAAASPACTSCGGTCGSHRRLVSCRGSFPQNADGASDSFFSRRGPLQPELHSFGELHLAVLDAMRGAPCLNVRGPCFVAGHFSQISSSL